MYDRRHNFCSRRTVTFEFVGDHPPRRLALLLQYLAEKALSCLLIFALLYQDIEDIVVLVYGAPLNNTPP